MSATQGSGFRRLVGRVADEATVDPEERELSGAVAGILYLLGGLTCATFLALPGLTQAHRGWVVGLVAVASLWGFVQRLAIDWSKAPPWLIHFSVLLGLVIIAMVMASTGGALSPGWVYLFFVAVFVSYFFSRTVALTFLAGCIVTHCLPLIYDHRATHGQYIAQLAIAAPAYVVFGSAIMSGKALMAQLRGRAERLAAEQSSMRRVATAVVENEPANQIYELVAREAAALLRGGAAGILRVVGFRETVVAGSWSDHPGGRYEPGTVVPIRPGSDIERALETNTPVRVEGHPPESPVGRLGYTSSIVAPIRVGGKVWGALAATAAFPDRLTEGDEQRLMEFGNLLSTAIASIEDRAKLAAQASSDPLTGLANHRTLQLRLGSEVSRAVRRESPLSVAVIDIDHFKQINDVGGHDAGDEMLARVAGALKEIARAEDILGRVGGDEFAWVLPDTTREQALLAVERARRTLANSVSESYRVTVSAGICDTAQTTDPAELIRLADGALYWSKAQGRNQCWVYDPQVVQELSAQERAERLERSQALLGLRALARAIDAKDPATREHSERVSSLVSKLALTAGWPAERARLLGEAALVHDVGKIGVPDAVLRKTEPLTVEEVELIAEHAELSGRIVEGVLTAEQVEWITTHHERPDGNGYPNGLEGLEISEGAALLSTADAWDVMTVSRPYSLPKTVDEALEECVQLIGEQFTETAVAALQKLYNAGELGGSHAQPTGSVKLLG